MYHATLQREEVKEGRIFSYYGVYRDDSEKFVGCIVLVATPTPKGLVEHWYVDAEMGNPNKQPCSDVQECFRRLFKSWKRRGGSLRK